MKSRKNLWDLWVSANKKQVSTDGWFIPVCAIVMIAATFLV